MHDSAKKIQDALANELLKADANGDIVLATNMLNKITEPMAEAIKSVYAGLFTTEEIAALSQLVFQATSDTKFYDWEMPTLVGYSRLEMQALGEKLRELANL